MKKSNVKKVVTIVAILSVCFNTLTTFAESDKSRFISANNVIMPMNIAIAATGNELTLGSGGKLSCFGETETHAGYVAEVIVELQKLNGGWETIVKWTDKAEDYAVIDNSRYVSSGYSYRLKITHKAYNSNGTLVETITKYSNTVVYSGN